MTGRRQRDAAAVLLLLPVVAAVVMFGAPLVGLLVRAPWSRCAELLASPALCDALVLSLLASLGATAVCISVGLPLAAWLAAGRSPLRTLVRLLVTLPMVLPPVVGGVALLLAFGRNGIVGGPLYAWSGASLPFTTPGVVLAEAWVAIPFFVLAAEAGLRGFDRRYADVAATLGAGRWRTFRTVTVPGIAPALRAACLVAWARALGEFGASITFAGNLAGSTRTLPLAVYTALETEPDAAIAMSLLLVGIAVGLLFLLRDRWLPLR